MGMYTLLYLKQITKHSLVAIVWLWYSAETAARAGHVHTTILKTDNQQRPTV